MPHDHDTVPAPNEVPWPDQPPHELQELALCCVECSNNTFAEVTIITDQGPESALQCTWCQEVYITADTIAAITWLESPQTVGHTRWYDELSRPYTWRLPMFWLKNDIDTGEGHIAMTVPASAYDDPHWRPL